MFSASGISPVFDILDGARRLLSEEVSVDVGVFSSAVCESFQTERSRRAEARWLKPLGLDLKTFALMECPGLLDGDKSTITRELQAEKQLNIQFLVGGFDSKGVGCLFSVQEPGVCSRRDIPGYGAIGSGAVIAS